MNLKIVAMIMKTVGLFMAFSANNTVSNFGLLILWSSWFVLNYHYSKSFIS